MPQILTNKFDLPQTLVAASQLDTHRVAGDISVTQILDGPRVRILKSLHTYEVDVSDNLYALMGTALHHILERANITSVRKRAFILTAETIMKNAEELSKTDPEKAAKLEAAANWIFTLVKEWFPEVSERYIFELTLRMEIGSFTVYGTFDIYDKETGTLYDYKFCSVYMWIFPENRVKWKRQTNIYAMMLRKTKGLPVNAIKLVAFFRDWNKHSLLRNKDYPDRQTKEVNIDVFNDEDILAYVQERLELHKRAEDGEDIDCTGDERWAKADEFAVKTPSAKRALRLFPSELLATGFIQENKHKYDKSFIEFRPGDSMKCAEFCPVSKFCSQRAKELEKQAKYRENNG